jgi:hypothetical protein
MVATVPLPSPSPRFSSAAVVPFFVVHRTNYARLLEIPHARRKHALAVYTVLSAHVNGETGTTHISYAAIAREAGIARSTAIETVRTLADNGLLDVEERHDPRGDRATNRYCLRVLPAVAAARGDRGSGQGVVRLADGIENTPSQEVDRRVVPVDSTPPPIESKAVEEPTASADDTDTWLTVLARDLRRQLRDRASAPATTGRLRNLYQRSGLTRDDFLDAVYEARRRTMKRGVGVAYLFAVLADMLGKDGATDAERARPRPPGGREGVAVAPDSIVERLERHENAHNRPMNISQPCHAWPSELVEMGIRSVPEYIRVCGRGLFADAEASVEYARRVLAARATGRSGR